MVSGQNNLVSSMNYNNAQNPLFNLSAAVAAAANQQQAANDLLKLGAVTGVQSIPTTSVLTSLACGNSSDLSQSMLFSSNAGSASPTSSNSTSIGTMPSSPGTISATSPTNSSVSSGNGSTDENTPISAPIPINPCNNLNLINQLQNSSAISSSEQLYSFLSSIRMLDQRIPSFNNGPGNNFNDILSAAANLPFKDDSLAAIVSAMANSNNQNMDVSSSNIAGNGSPSNNSFVDVCTV
uniref:Fork-head domain-containing protein n=1 Tax=Rhabditophanes sp. KR3021 TaxID=114890 RepID=A0AC35UHB5_9BILA